MFMIVDMDIYMEMNMDTDTYEKDHFKLFCLSATALKFLRRVN
jgi:hypothetical protein